MTADTRAIAEKARHIVMDVERRMGFEPTDREFEKLGYDIESRVPETGRLLYDYSDLLGRAGEPS